MPRSKQKVEETYIKLSEIGHVLKRPDTTAGSIHQRVSTQLIYDEDTKEYKFKSVESAPAWLNIFNEIAMNATDHKGRNPDEMTVLKFTINPQKNCIKVYNNGPGIPVQMHSDWGMYVPQGIFGSMRTSTNYSDDAVEGEYLLGRNGYGAKLTNIFSTKFMLETYDGECLYKQTWKDNMHKAGKPTIVDFSTSTRKRPKEEYTCITYYPDLVRFGLTEMNDDAVTVLKQQVYDIAGIVPNLNVYLNGKKIKSNTFKKYSMQIAKCLCPSRKRTYMEFSDNLQVALSISDTGFQQVSYVNNKNTSIGGTHVNLICTKIVNMLHKKLKNVSKSAIKNKLCIIMNTRVPKPSFSSQTKEELTAPTKSYIKLFQLTDAGLQSMVKTIATDLKKELHTTDANLDTVDDNKRTKMCKEHDPAHFSGTNKSLNCTLMIVEGGSARTLAVSGRSVVDSRYYGIYTLRGKMINPLDVKVAQLKKNRDIQNLVTILGIKKKPFVYTEDNLDTLKYGKLMMMTDQDTDGSHIKGLVINFLKWVNPSLLEVPGFLQQFVTPLIKVKVGKTFKSFFTENEYKTWCRNSKARKNCDAKYYKGLGTSTPEEARGYFKEIDVHRVPFHPFSDVDMHMVDASFNKKRADVRKEMMEAYYLERSKNPYISIDYSEPTTYKDFCELELSTFWDVALTRSLPAVADGFKESQRKILCAAFGYFKTHKQPVKVCQLAAYTSEKTHYHHGEVSLSSAIVKMAQTYAGSNNINLLYPSGQFGTRLENGKDAAATRYIFTKVMPIARALFPLEDDNVLNYREVEGHVVEPESYAPILPMLLINGANGIAVGWSTKIPMHNPAVLSNLYKDMVNACDPPMRTASSIKKTLSTFKARVLKEVQPWFRGFNGSIEKNEDSTVYTMSGVYETVKQTAAYTQIHITELPIGTAVKPFVDKLREAAYTTRVSDGSDDVNIDITVQFKKDTDIQKIMDKCMHTNINMTNMHSCVKDSVPLNFESVYDIIVAHFLYRAEIYKLRKAHNIRTLNEKIRLFTNKWLFINAVVTKKLELRGTPKATICKSLDKLGLDKLGDVKSYDYLLNMPMSSMTKENVQKMKKHVDKLGDELAQLENTHVSTLWLDDLQKFDDEYIATMAQWEKSRGDTKKPLKRRKNLKAAKKPAKKPAVTRKKRKAASKPRAVKRCKKSK